MARVLNASQVAEKWKRRAATAQGDFEQGVKNPRRSWADSAAASEGAYEAGIQEAISQKRFGKGVEAAGDEKWVEKTTKIGAQRWAPGVAAAEGDMREGFAPYVEVINSTRDKLGPRGPRGSPSNMQRASDMAAALHHKRVSG